MKHYCNCQQGERWTWQGDVSPSLQAELGRTGWVQFCSSDELKSIEDNDQIAVTYCDHKGNDDEKNNPNGALKNIAGIFNKDKNILGMMPHPERMIDPFLSGEDGSLFFENLIGSL